MPGKVLYSISARSVASYRFVCLFLLPICVFLSLYLNNSLDIQCMLSVYAIRIWIRVQILIVYGVCLSAYPVSMSLLLHLMMWLFVEACVFIVCTIEMLSFHFVYRVFFFRHVFFSIFMSCCFIVCVCVLLFIGVFA